MGDDRRAGWRTACAQLGLVTDGLEATAHQDVHAAAAAAAPLLDRVDRLSAEERYEDAALLRDRVAVLVRAVRRRQRLESLADVPELVLARADGEGGWHLSVVRRGRLVSAGCAPRGTSVRGTLAELMATAETPTGPDGELAASVDETELVLRYMEKPNTRLVQLDGTLAKAFPILVTLGVAFAVIRVVLTAVTTHNGVPGGPARAHRSRRRRTDSAKASPRAP